MWRSLVVFGVLGIAFAACDGSSPGGSGSGTDQGGTDGGGAAGEPGPGGTSGAGEGGSAVSGRGGRTNGGGSSGRGGADRSGEGGDAGASGDGSSGTGGAGMGGDAGAGGDSGAGGEGWTGWAMPMPNPVESGLPNPHSYTLVGDGTVRDNVTGLVWEEAPQHHHHYRGFTVAEAVGHCDDLVLGGHDDWRLPTRVELVSLVDFTRFAPALDPVFIPEIPNQDPYTLALPSEDDSGVFAIHFALGEVIQTDSEEMRGYVRCVRPERREPRIRYVIGGTRHAGLVLDMLTGLRWQRSASRLAVDWAEAEAHCEDLVVGETANFRLPSVKELQTLVADDRWDPAMDSGAFPDAPNEAFWSSRFENSVDSAWCVNFWTGSTIFCPERVPSRVRCVVADDDGSEFEHGSPDGCEARTCSGHGTCSLIGGDARCDCEVGFVRDATDPLVCKDVDECVTNHGGCDPLVACVNTPGGRICRDCPPGYRGTGERACLPITDCFCQNGGTCVENGSSLACDCPPGFLGTACETRLVSLAPGIGFTCAVRSDGAAQCFGVNSEGQASPPGGSFSTISSGSAHACGIRLDGSVVCWGLNSSSQATPPAGRFRTISAGYSHTCGIRDDGTVACWGANESGQSTPPADLFDSIAVGLRHSCGLRHDATLACWGDPASSTLPSAITGRTYRAVSIANRGGPYAPTLDTCALQADDDRVRCWSSPTDDPHSFGPYATWSGDCGMRADGTVSCRRWVADAPQGSFVALSGGFDHSCGIRSSGEVECWGATVSRYVAPPSGAFLRPSIPCSVRIDGSLLCSSGTTLPGSFVEAWGTCALRTDGTPVCDGASLTLPQEAWQALSTSYALFGLRFDGTLAQVWSGMYDPWQISGTYRAIAGGNSFQCAIATNFRLHCWGYNAWNAIAVTDEPVIAVGADYDRTCAIRASDKTLACWGDGAGTPPSGTFESLSPEGGCAIRSDGTIACWPEPAESWKAPPIGSFTAVAGTAQQGCAIASDLTLRCWGHIVR